MYQPNRKPPPLRHSGKAPSTETHRPSATHATCLILLRVFQVWGDDRVRWTRLRGPFRVCRGRVLGVGQGGMGEFEQHRTLGIRNGIDFSCQLSLQFNLTIELQPTASIPFV